MTQLCFNFQTTKTNADVRSHSKTAEKSMKNAKNWDCAEEWNSWSLNGFLKNWCYSWALWCLPIRGFTDYFFKLFFLNFSNFRLWHEQLLLFGTLSFLVSMKLQMVRLKFNITIVFNLRYKTSTNCRLQKRYFVLDGFKLRELSI